MPGGDDGRGREGLLRLRLRLLVSYRPLACVFSRASTRVACPIALRGIGGRSHRYLTASLPLGSIRAARPHRLHPKSSKALRGAAGRSTKKNAACAVGGTQAQPHPKVFHLRARRHNRRPQKKLQRDDGVEQLLLLVLRGQRRAPQAQGEEAPQEGKKTPPQGGKKS